jgi:transcriptional regulator with XRE-family HTH domain
VGYASQFVGRRLRELRGKADLSQEQTAHLVGVTFKYYQRLEGGKVLGIRLSTIERIADAYSIDLFAFFSKRIPKIQKPKMPPAPHRPKKREK